MKWLQLVPPAGAIVLLALAALIAPTPALAVDNVVRIDPSGIEVAPGGAFRVKLIDDPTPDSTAIWAIDVVYDPSVVSTTDADCKGLVKPAGASTTASICQVVDADKDGANETVKVLGVFLFNDTGMGLLDVATLADITFHVIGEAGACTDLHLRIRSHADKDGNETGALVQDGRACIEADAPPSGTASPVPVTPRTSEPTDPPTPVGGTGAATPSGSQQNGSPGQTAPTGGQGTAGGSTGPANGSATPRASGSGLDGGDDGGTSPLVWVLAGGIVLVLAAGAAWSLVRLRGPKPPSDGPSS